MAAVWGVEHFAYFLLGRHFTLRVDSKGISFILNRTREDSKRVLTRADGWALRLSPYSYEVEYIKGTDNIADTPSRLYTGKDDPFNENSSPWEIAKLEVNLVGFLTEEEIREATASDETLAGVRSALGSEKWPKKLRRYQQVASDLHYSDGLIVKNGCIVIPSALQKKTLEIAHKGHPLTAKFKSILRERVWWPGMPGDAENWVKGCQICATNGRPERPTPMRRKLAPNSVWDTIAVDFNGPYSKFGGVYIFVLVDYRSRYIIARPTKSTSFEHTKAILEDVFDREGFPQTIKSDNGPPFNGDEYKSYCSARGIKTVFSTPLFPQQNGLAEAYMKVINKAMAAAVSSGNNYNDELQAAVRAHNAAAHTITKVPPEEVMLGRKIKRGLPLLDRSKTLHDEDLLTARDREAKLRGKSQEDRRRSARKCRIQPGDVVIVERQNRAKGDSRFGTKRYTVLEEENGSLLLVDEDGATMRRHVTLTKKVYKWAMNQEPFDDKAEDVDVWPEDTSAASGRPKRGKKTPSYLKDYVQVVDQQE